MTHGQSRQDNGIGRRMTRTVAVVCLFAGLLACLLAATALFTGCQAQTDLLPAPPASKDPALCHVQSADDDFGLASGGDTSYEHHYYYAHLNEQEQAWYRILHRALSSHARMATLDGVDYLAMQNSLRAVLMDYPELFYVRPDGVYHIGDKTTMYEIPYNATLVEATEQRAAIDAIAIPVADSVRDQPTDRDKLWALTVWLSNHITYDWDAVALEGTEFYNEYADTNTMYGALVNGNAICGGYAYALDYLCQALGIECIYVEGNIDSPTMQGNHAWNVVLADGAWGNLDPTWSDDEQNGHITDAHFLTPDSDHNQDVTEWFVPAAVPDCL